MKRTFVVIQWVGNPDEQQIKNRLFSIGGQIERLEEIENEALKNKVNNLCKEIEELKKKLTKYPTIFRKIIEYCDNYLNDRNTALEPSGYFEKITSLIWEEVYKDKRGLK